MTVALKPRSMQTRVKDGACNEEGCWGYIFPIPYNLYPYQRGLVSSTAGSNNLTGADAEICCSAISNGTRHFEKCDNIRVRVLVNIEILVPKKDQNF